MLDIIIYAKVSAILKELGYDINIDKLDKIDAVTKAHIALDIIENMQNERTSFKKVWTYSYKGEFIETVMNEGCPAYVQKENNNSKRMLLN